MMRVQQVRKVRRQRRPGYPTRPEVARDPELLRRHVPPVWKKSAQVTAALSIMLAAAYAEDPPTKEKAAKVAPIFDHGDGRGAMGCVAMNPPRFFSEEEALKIIADETGKASLPLTLRSAPLQEVRIHQDRYALYNKETGTHLVTPPGIRPLEFDLADKDRRVAVEFVSYDDYFTQGGTRDCSSSAWDMDFKGLAKSLATRIGDADKTSGRFYGVFYDPAGDLGTGQAYQSPADLLRAQVKDFIEWLKGQGAI